MNLSRPRFPQRFVKDPRLLGDSHIQNAAGFALVVALSLMSFILLLLLSLVSFVRLGNVAANVEIQNLIARQNALLGVQVALGTLQSEMGPDQRISASATLLDLDPATREIEGVAEPRWTGVYDSENWSTNMGRIDPIPDFEGRDRFRRWLVSQNPEAPAFDPETFGGGGDDDPLGTPVQVILPVMRREILVTELLLHMLWGIVWRIRWFLQNQYSIVEGLRQISPIF